MTKPGKHPFADFVEVRGAEQHNLRNIDVNIPRNAFVVFTGVSGSGKSSLAFGTVYAEAQRRYFESIAPYARRLLDQLPAPHVREIKGLPPVVGLQQKRGEPTVRSSLGTITGLSNLLRMLFSRAGAYPKGLARLDSDAFSSNTHIGACARCHGIGNIHTVTESSLVPDPNLTIREKAIAAWPGAWQGKNYRDILSVLGYDVDKPWKELAQKDRDWVFFTEEKPVVTVYAEREAHRIQRPYQGTYMSAASYVMHTFANTNSPTLRKRVSQFMESSLCPECKGKKLNADALLVKFAGHDIAELSQMPLCDLANLLHSWKTQTGNKTSKQSAADETANLISADLLERISLMSALGLDYLSLDRNTPSLSSGELQRLRLSKQLRSGLFGVIYILDEPTAGLHPSDTESLLAILGDILRAGNSLFIVEHDMELVKKADWIVDLGPRAGELGGELIFSGPVDAISSVSKSCTAKFLTGESADFPFNQRRKLKSWLKLRGVNCNNLNDLNVEFPLSAFTAVTGVSGSGKTTLVSKVLSESLGQRSEGKSSGNKKSDEDDESEDEDSDGAELAKSHISAIEGDSKIKRVVIVDQKPIGRTPRSNLATYTGIFDLIRQKFAASELAKSKGFTASRFSFNVEGGRCPACNGEGFVSVELLFLPSVYSPCTVCNGARYNDETLEVKYNKLNISEVLQLTVSAARDFFADTPALERALQVLIEIGLGYLRIGQPATELSGGEAQRIKLASELQRAQKGDTLYLLDEPTTGLHPSDVHNLLQHLHRLVDAGNTVIAVEHDMTVICSADWVIDLGPGAGSKGGKIVACGTPESIAKVSDSKTAAFVAKTLKASQSIKA